MNSELITDKFKDIRPLYDSEVPSAIENLISDSAFRKVAEPFVKPLSWEQLSAALRNCKSVDDFQQYIIYPLLKPIIDKTTTDLSAENWENLQDGQSHVVISNHRDIVLDAAFLNMLIHKKGIPTTEIAIGDNLLIYPWITELVRLNKSFIVRRGVSIRQMLEVSKHLSEYIFDTVANRNQSVWIAQREGRAKDSDDRTQTGLLKMLTLHDAAQPRQALKSLRILPLSISYEFDPCDFLKAKEFQLKRDNPNYKKTEQDDLENMLTGIQGFKGRVKFCFGKQINDELRAIPETTGRAEILDIAANLIDKEIHENYVFFPINYIAYDMMTGTETFSDHYSDEEKDKFNDYLIQQVNKVDIPNKDVKFLRERIVEMYANTVKNNLIASNEQ